jgi:glutamate synthase domain-containing protein 3
MAIKISNTTVIDDSRNLTNIANVGVSGVSTISVNSSSDALRITQEGTGNALVVEDSTNPDATPFVVKADGSVGIGTTNPIEELHVKVDQNAGTIIRVENDFIGSSAHSSVRVSSSSTTVLLAAHSPSRTGTKYGISQGGYGELSLNSGNGLLVGTLNASSLILGTNDTEALRIDSSQRVGIGTTNPTSTLQVQGTVSVSSTTTSAEFVGGGSDLRNLSGTHLVSYASHSETSNSALSIAGISTYNQVGILTGSLAVDTTDFFGYSVATSADGKTIVVGAYNDEIGATTGTGVAYVYDRVGSSFNQVGILTGSLAVDANDNFGISVATSADGKTIVVGANFDEIGANASSGVAYVYDRVGSSFNQVGILTGSLAVDASDNFGQSVATSADGKTIVVGAWIDEIGANTSSGVVYVYDRIGSSFNQVGILTGSLAVDANDGFGFSVATSADGKTIIVGARADEIGATTGTGVVYVYDRIGSSFNQVGILTGSLATNASDNFGTSVATSADGKTIVVGAWIDEIGATTGTGVVYVYDRIGSSFNQVGILTGSLAVDTNDNFGQSVATSADGKTIIVGASADEIGANTSSGVAYIFKRQGNSFNQVGILTGSLAVDASDNFGQSVATSADGKTIVVGAYNDEIGATTGTGVVYVFDETRDTYVYSGPTGNIGIGTTNPTSKLEAVDLAATPSVAPVIFIQRPNNVAPASVGVTNAELRIKGHSANHKIYVEDQNANPLFIVEGDGSVGIGTTNPGAKLYVSGGANNYTPTASGTGLFEVHGGTSTYSMYIGIDDQGGYIGHNGSARKLFFDVNETTRMTIDSSGNLGIGTTTPGARLHAIPTSTGIAGLFSGTTSNDMVRITQLGTGNALVVEDETNPDASPFVVNASGSVGIGTTNPGTTLDVRGEVWIGGVSSSLRWRTGSTEYATARIFGNDLAFEVASAERLRLTSAGRIGIGTTNPGSALDVQGNILIRDTTADGTFTSPGNLAVKDNSSDPYISFHNAAGGRVSYVQATAASGMFIVQENTLPLVLRNEQNESIIFQTSNTERVRITGIGSVGIGLTNPSAALTIATAGIASDGRSQIYLNGATSNRIDFNTNGLAAPSTVGTSGTTRSIGTKIVLFPTATNDYAFGTESSHIWSSIPSGALGWKWYGGNVGVATLSVAGALSLSGGLTLGTNSNIVADFSNATLISRSYFITNTTNGSTVVGAIPNGTNATTGFLAFNNSTPTNATYCGVVAGATGGFLRVATTGTGAYLPLNIETNNVTQVAISTGGEVTFTKGIVISAGIATIPTVSVTATTASTTTTTGALTVAGGVGIAASVHAGGDVDGRRFGSNTATVTMSGTPANIATIAATGTVGLVTFATAGIAATVNVTGMIAGQILNLFITNPTTAKVLTIQYNGTAIAGSGIATASPAQGTSFALNTTKYYRFMAMTDGVPIAANIRVVAV